jgi:N-acetylglucosamine kinase-like BadF-type ATPase
MQLIADSGSTKTSWRLVKSLNDVKKASTIGYNPHYFTTEKMEASLRADLLPLLNVSTEEIKEIYFYGAGCSSVVSNKIVEDAFKSIFNNAMIEVDHDLLGAARALCGKEAGIAGILGTGSNSCSFDGKNITDNVTSLGFMLGDEGSGASLGRQLVKAFFYRDLPKDISEKFYNAYKMDKDAIFHNVYKSALPSRYMAQFSKFISANIEHPVIYNLVKAEMTRFVDTQISKYENIEKLPIHLLGSVAFYFRDIIQTIFDERGYTLGRIIREPIETLVDYHN